MEDYVMEANTRNWQGSMLLAVHVTPYPSGSPGHLFVPALSPALYTMASAGPRSPLQPCPFWVMKVGGQRMERAFVYYWNLTSSVSLLTDE